MMMQVHQRGINCIKTSPRRTQLSSFLFFLALLKNKAASSPQMAVSLAYAPTNVGLVCPRSAAKHSPAVGGREIAIPSIEHSQDSDGDDYAEHRGEQADASGVFD